MKIGIDIRALMDKEYSGVSWYTLDLLTEILRQDRSNEYVLSYNSGRDISARIPKFEQSNVKTFFTRYPNKLYNYFLQRIFHWPKLDKVSEGVDVFWLPHLAPASFSPNCRLVLTIHDLSFLDYPEFFSAHQNFWHKFLGIKKLIERADIIVAISENTKRDIIRIFSVNADKIKVIKAGVGDEFRPRQKDENELKIIKQKYDLPDKFILNVGTIEPRKNLPGLIRGFDEAASQPGMGDWYLVLAGAKGWKNKDFYRAIAQAKNKARIRILGYVEKNERAALYNWAEIFAYPSFYEGFGLPVIEAMASGTPVITSALSSLPEVAGDAALLVDPHDENSLITALQSLMQNDKLRELYSSRGLERAKNFSWEKTAEQYIKIFLNE